ncbi:glutamate carboxypeptidase [Desulfonatronum thiosulfatophilum]|uniref:Glutamate carboxypeptidase n=1 Tax=Desulfonatronum thiosulfatophilum TaxID=617002 RepID=A0A1G6A2R2_9BACT|nr:M20 family metallopeptidase [Desulfonatronum thiosulfatophilum]SDB02506.1 glutamate carboxypeptidase [Desulfonatronum thiosulfatophilum]
MYDKIAEYIAAHEAEALALLRRLVEIQSGSWNKPGLDRMAVAMADVLGGILPQVRVLPYTSHGNMVQGQTLPAAAGSRGILLVGHMDTVFPADTSFTMYREDAQNCYGPGVYDMKGGLVAGVYALKALDHLGLLEKIPVTFFCNSDEEIGSPASKTWIDENAMRNTAALVLEGGGINREVVTGRKGRMGLRMTVRGQARHAAKPGPKASALLEAAHKVIALEALNNNVEITVNVGRVEGGIGPNTVPDTTTLLVDARFLSSHDQQRLEEEIRSIAARNTIPGTSCELEMISGRPAMPQSAANMKLFEVARLQAAAMGYDLPQELRFGVSDANYIADHGIPVLDGLGPVGDMDHSDQEYIVKQSVMERACLVAATLLALSATFPS